jgi:hypothetical protein
MAKSSKEAEKASTDKKETEQVTRKIEPSNVQTLGTIGSAAKTNDGRPAPIHPDDVPEAGEPKEQVTTGSDYVDQDSTIHLEVNENNMVELAVDPGTQAYSQVIRTTGPDITGGDTRLVKVKISYPDSYKGAKFLVEGQTYEVSPETAGLFIHKHKIGTEVKK